MKRLRTEKLYTIFVVVCSFIPFFGVIISWFSKYNFVKYQIYAFYHAITSAGITALYIKHFVL